MKTMPRISRISQVFAAGLLAVASTSSLADGMSKIRVMTQNQYLGADLAPVAAAGSPAAFNAALIDAISEVGTSNYPERVQSLAATIAERSPHLVGLQEMFAFGCTPVSSTIPNPCGLFGPAFNDHTAATVSALQSMGADYREVATVKNLAIDFVLPGPTAVFNIAGLPVFLDADLMPDVFVTVVDRDVILARGNVAATPVTFACAKPSVDGCNYQNVASINISGNEINIERGFVAVDATIEGDSYRFVNTHLEVRLPDPTNPLSQGLQALQATELLLAMTMNPEPAGSRVVLVGDINSDPNDVPGIPILTPYQQITTGLAIDTTPVSAAFSDIWLLRPRAQPGLTCCEDGDLLNEPSAHVRRVDIIFSKSIPDNVNASKVLNTSTDDKTASGLWPSDHASVDAMLQFLGR